MTPRRSRSSAPGIRVRPAALVGGPLSVLLIALAAHAHDFWLVPDPFQVAEGGTIEVLGQTSSRFPTSEVSVTVGRVVDARLIGARVESRITDLSQRGKSLLLRHKPPAAGQYVVAVSLHPRSVRAHALRLAHLGDPLVLAGPTRLRCCLPSRISGLAFGSRDSTTSDR